LSRLVIWYLPCSFVYRCDKHRRYKI